VQSINQGNSTGLNGIPTVCSSKPMEEEIAHLDNMEVRIGNLFHRIRHWDEGAHGGPFFHWKPT
jgi:hypothetical protein